MAGGHNLYMMKGLDLSNRSTTIRCAICDHEKVLRSGFLVEVRKLSSPVLGESWTSSPGIVGLNTTSGRSFQKTSRNPYLRKCIPFKERMKVE